jgi:FkbM family methyltransferase
MPMKDITRADRPGYLSRLADRLTHKRRTGQGQPIEYRYGNFSIQLPPGHMLPAYQRGHPKYDRFLPHLAKHLSASDRVIDVGANVGDTLAAMYEANPKLRYICIEPDDLFFDQLLANIERIRQAGNIVDVRAIKALVGASVSASSLDGRDGTKHAVATENGKIASEPLDKLIGPDEGQSIRLLKTDVDGFDYDVINSASSIIENSRPYIFFELQNDNESQYAEYLKTLKKLESAGYTDWFIFDNFGSLMFKAPDIRAIEQIMSYVWNQNIGRSTRTVYYVDVLAVQKSDTGFIEEVLKSY